VLRSRGDVTLQISGDALVKALMTDYTPFIGQPAREPKLKLLRTLWTMHRARPQSTVTAAIWQTETGHELRVIYNDDPDNMLDTVLSRTGDAPLEQRATDLRGVLASQGWTEAER